MDGLHRLVAPREGSRRDTFGKFRARGGSRLGKRGGFGHPAAMFLATIHPAKRLLVLDFIGHVTVADLERGTADLKTLLPLLAPGFRLLTDLSRLDRMDLACVPLLGQTMELMESHHAGLIVRVVPEDAKDIGFNIISAFHYRQPPHAATCATLEEAARVLEL